MKTILSTIALVACVAMTVSAQDMNQLKFSRVLLINQTTNQTVPAGKVWKIESVIFSIPFTSNGLTDNANSNCGANLPEGRGNISIYVNDQPTRVGGFAYTFLGSNSSHNDLYRTNLPFWLPANSSLRVQCAQQQISVIEFTVVPE